MLVSVGGELVVERYYRDRRRDDRTNVHSVTKSVLSTLVGIAIGDGRVSTATTIGDIMPDRVPAEDPAKATITVEHLLTMTSGLAADGEWDIDELADAGRSWVDGPLLAPLRREPGTAFAYNNGAAHVLGVLLAAAVGRPQRTFAEERLFGPLGIPDYRWPEDPEGNVLGYGHLELRPIDLVRLGELYLDPGGVVDPEYVAKATSAANPGGPPERTGYGYLWWVAERAGAPAFFAGGFGGQYVTVVPSRQLVVVTTGDVDVLIPSSADPLLLVEETIVPALDRGVA